MTVPVEEWYYCVSHDAVEPAVGCPAKDRLGPYATREDAQQALETAQRNTEEWDEADEAWEGD